ncbi:hypothetical protein C8R43DRAFT_1238363 [Mycena crocata]|nr:hypothetical protein C8R43DRAFT_1238363 [Mycena crocata]
MHPNLRLAGLSVLPGFIRRTATSAARGSLEDLEHLRAMVADGSGEHFKALLAVFYIHLDPKGIPSLNSPASSFAAGNNAVSRAWESLLSIYTLGDVPMEAFLEMWPSLWKWVHFFQIHCDLVFIEEDNGLEGGICLSFISFIARLPLSDGTIQMMLATPKVVYLMTRAWMFRLQEEEEEDDLSIIYPCIVHLLLQHKGSMTATTIKEMVEGAGGTCADLASLISVFSIVSYIDAVLPGHTDFMNTDQLYLLSHLVDFVTAVDDILEGRTFSHYRQSLGMLCQSLLPVGITRALSNVAYGLIHQNEMQGVDTLLRQCMILFIRILGDSWGYQFIGEALRAGLLLTMASCAAFGVMTPSNTILLEQILPTALIYYFDVQDLEQAFKQAEPIIHCEPFQTCSIIGKWRAFAVQTRERVAILHSLSATPCLRACDNVKCGQIMEKTRLKRCSACLSFYYCSPDCQRMDWKEGGHREACSSGHSFHFGGGVAEKISVRERMFMRAVLAHGYKAQKWTTVHPQQVAFMTANPGVPYFTLFDYRTGSVKVAVHATSAPHGGAPDWDAFAGATSWDQGIASSREWLNDISRASQSGGNLQLHVMAIPTGARTRYLVVPLRTNDAQTHGALTRVASLSPRPREISELVRGVELTEVEDGNTVEVH